MFDENEMIQFAFEFLSKGLTVASQNVTEEADGILLGPLERIATDVRVAHQKKDHMNFSLLVELKSVAVPWEYHENGKKIASHKVSLESFRILHAKSKIVTFALFESKWELFFSFTTSLVDTRTNLLFFLFPPPLTQCKNY